MLLCWKQSRGTGGCSGGAASDDNLRFRVTSHIYVLLYIMQLMDCDFWAQPRPGLLWMSAETSELLYDTQTALKWWLLRNFPWTGSLPRHPALHTGSRKMLCIMEMEKTVAAQTQRTEQSWENMGTFSGTVSHHPTTTDSLWMAWLFWWVWFAPSLF